MYALSPTEHTLNFKILKQCLSFAAFTPDEIILLFAANY